MAVLSARRSLGLLVCVTTLAACSGSSGSTDGGGSAAPAAPAPSAPAAPTPDGSLLRVSGSVGDGPVVDADSVVTDASGRRHDAAQSDAFASYRLTLPSDSALPVRITAAGGTDLVTGRPLDFTLHAAALETGSLTVNLSPLTTVAVLAAECVGGVTAERLQEAWERVHASLSIGLDRAVMADPMHEAVTQANAESVVLFNEALGEAVRRSVAALAPPLRPWTATACCSTWPAT